MSRLARKPLIVPAAVNIEKSGQVLAVKGPKGALNITLPSLVEVNIEGKELKFSVKHPEKAAERALLGLSVRLVANACIGVEKGFEQNLEIQGIGYKAAVEKKEIVLEIGFSHPVRVELPEGIEASVDKNTLTLKSIDKQLVGELAARLRSLRPPEPYKGKGIRYQGELVRKKAGKAAKAAGAKA